MLRISPVDGGNHHIVLRLEGRVAGPWVIELSKACENALSEGQGLELNMAEVSFVDSNGVLLFSKLKARGVSLVACSPFVEGQLRSL